MNNVDWSSAPLGAQYYANKAWWKANDAKCGWLVFVGGVWLCAESTVTFECSPFFYDDVISKSDHIVDVNEKVWPESDERTDIIGQNGNDGEHYQQEPTKTAADFLSEGLRILSERGKEYDPNGTKERSFAEVAAAFNVVTGNRLKGSDVCLMLTLLKIVRQNAAKGFHLDSAIDGVNYMALYAELLQKESQ